jgi:flagellar biosynthesis/type III secretory pathway protein FliH
MALHIVTSWEEEGYERGIKEGVERGIKEGVERGIKEGLERGKVTVILRQLTRRLGSIPTDVETRIHALANGALDELGEALLDFTSPDDLSDWLKGRATTTD